ncbi:hypothetical protein [Pseudomonas umsongensis]|uniref:hypothetical protein n=1 Tax=Pseudomonas umsongensis TaxID=198618 RepID=UPI00038198C0|nr:hypothetical protein [Pseudomonas umsongensis]
MYDQNICLGCGLPFEPVEWSADLSGIGDDFTNWMTFVDDEVCQCATEDDDD